MGPFNLRWVTVSRSRRPRRLKGVTNVAGGPDIGGRPPAEMSSVQALMELTLPRFAMPEGPVTSIRRGRLRQNRRHRRHQTRLSSTGEWTPAVQWTRHQCTLIWMHLPHPQTRNQWMLRNAETCRLRYCISQKRLIDSPNPK